MILERFPINDNKISIPVNDINVIMYCALLYKEIPDDIEIFRKNYPYFDPSIIDSKENKYHFLELTKKDISKEEFLNKINLYLNVKFNPIYLYKSLDENLKKFQQLANCASYVLHNILKRAELPSFVESVLEESQLIKNTNNIIELIKIYKEAPDEKTKYEITRKIGLTFLLSRIKNTLKFQKSKKFLEYITNLFQTQLQIRNVGKTTITYYWMDANDKLAHYDNKDEALTKYSKDVKEREHKGKIIYPMQKEEFNLLLTKDNNAILKFITRAKNLNNTTKTEDYTSVVEKIVRKNIAFPADIFDLYGVTFVVLNENELLNLMGEIETFLGGTNTRKEEKRIQKAPISEFYSSNNGEYFKIWKAIYDITFPHERLEVIEKQIKQHKKDIKIIEKTLRELEDKKRFSFLDKHLEEKYKNLNKLKSIKEKYLNKPFDLQVEIQIQDINSYLLSKCKGSITDHDTLKKHQVLSSSLYKLFPKEIYEKYLLKVKEQFLAKYIS